MSDGTHFSVENAWLKIAATKLGVPIEEYVFALNDGKKICGGCRRSLPRDAVHFGAMAAAFDKLKSRCRTCTKEAKKEHYSRTRPQQRERQLRYQQENRERLYAYNAKWQRERNAALRAELLEAYGKKCNCCGERERIFLDLDHINNDGAEHRRELGNGTQVMLALKAQGWPKDRYQLLCCNCNQGKARNGGICPHKTVQS